MYKKVLLPIVIMSLNSCYAEIAPDKTAVSGNQTALAKTTQPMVIKGQEDPDYGPQILATFFTQLVPGLAKMAIGSESDNAQLQSDGIDQFAKGLANFAYFVTRSPQAFSKFLDNKEELNEFFHEQQEQRSECLSMLRKYIPSAEKIS